MKIYSRPLKWDPATEAAAAERDGFDGVRVIDHFAIPHTDGQASPAPHSLVTLTAAAVATKRLALTQTMMCVSFRHPGELAQAIATLARIAPGRVELGLGAGWYKYEHDAFGFEFSSPGQRLQKVREAAIICRQMLHHNGVVSYEGKYFSADFDIPWPDLPETPPILIGGSGPRLLQLAGEVADRVDLLHTIREGSPLLDAEHRNDQERVVAMRDTAIEAAAGVGNKPAISATIFASLGEDASDIDNRRRDLAEVAQSTPGWVAEDLLYVVGNQDHLFDRISVLASIGVDRVHIGTVGPNPDRTLAMARELIADVHDL